MNVDIYGKNFEVADEPADFWGWVTEGRYSAEWEILHRCLRPEHTFLDLGAWVGSHSLFASTIAHRVVAVEPDPIAIKIVSANIAPLPSISVCHGAIMGYEGEVTLGSGFLGASTTRVNPNAGGGIGAWEEGHKFDIKCTTLRKFAEFAHLEDPLFIKMDVEGAEEQIIQDIEFFEEHRPTLYLELHPFWWKDEQTAWENIHKVAALYKNVLNLQMRPVDLSSTLPRSIVLADAA